MRLLVAAACGVMMAGPPAARTPIDAPVPADAAAIVKEAVRTGRHPWLRRPGLADVGPALRDLYGAEPDGLFWFADGRADPALPRAVSAVAAAAERGLDT